MPGAEGNEPESDLMSAAEVARAYGISARLIRRWAAEGRLPTVAAAGAPRLRRAEVGRALLVVQEQEREKENGDARPGS